MLPSSLYSTDVASQIISIQGEYSRHILEKPLQAHQISLHWHRLSVGDGKNISYSEYEASAKPKINEPLQKDIRFLWVKTWTERSKSGEENVS